MGCGSSNATDADKKYENFDWNALYEKLPTVKDDEHKKKRLDIWNNQLGCKGKSISFEDLSAKLGDYLQLPADVVQKDPMKKAYDAAKTRAKSKSSVGDDYVEWMEFRIFLVYLRQYFEYWVMFERLDQSGDAQINLEEFKKAVDMLKKNSEDNETEKWKRK